ncbi:MarR family winged helix-turn-helix transcriptional regulator [Afipia sp. GAS231]|uniref:MarR family winged helix-turn-helix transcriptional regulator n=1 Tax=Afipia sp. GAS231 TaxID=1882747 RepID=UPI00087CAA59|nr:MarR family transcriptional regulator [Afipia sp. GAS231]SDN73577.1 transcriptional regulator, MarR family [Afipia sp. GAS231]
MYRLSNSLPYLLARVGIRMGDLFVRVVKKEGLTLPMYRVLAALAEQEQPLRLVELSALTSADLSTLSRLVADMHKAGFVSRERPANDQRSLQVELTPAGRELYDRFMPVAAYYEEVATGDLSRKDAAALKATLASLYDNLDRLEAEVESGDVAQLIKPERPTRERAPGKGRPPK